MLDAKSVLICDDAVHGCIGFPRSQPEKFVIAHVNHLVHDLREMLPIVSPANDLAINVVGGIQIPHSGRGRCAFRVVIKARSFVTRNDLNKESAEYVTGRGFPYIGDTERGRNRLAGNRIQLGNISHSKPSSFIAFRHSARNIHGLSHGSQLEEIDDADYYSYNKTVEGKIEGVRFASRYPLHWIPFLGAFLKALFWVSLCVGLGHIHILSGGGRAPALWFMTLLLMAVSAAQFIKSMLRACDLLGENISVTQKCLTRLNYCNTLIHMANALSADKKIAVISALAEGSSIRSIERITGIHRDTIMRLGVKVGQGCTMLMDSKMQDLSCNYLQFDELWGFIGKKERHVSVDDDPELGDVWTFCAIDAETKLVPTFRCGKRTAEMANEFVQDVASRMANRVQISTDALHTYVEAVERSFGADVDYGQIVKVYVHDGGHHPERHYSAPSFAKAMRRPISGNPDMRNVSTSYVERLNATTRLHMKRLNRLTLAFSKKLENFKAATGLHFAYYNFVKRHSSLRCTPAMAAGIERDFWTVGDLLEATA